MGKISAAEAFASKTLLNDRNNFCTQLQIKDFIYRFDDLVKDVLHSRNIEIKIEIDIVCLGKG